MRYLIFFIHSALVEGDIGILTALDDQPSAAFSVGKNRLKSRGGFRKLLRQYIHVFSVLANDRWAGKGQGIIVGIEDSFTYENISGILYGREHFCHCSIEHVLVVNGCATEVDGDK